MTIRKTLLASLLVLGFTAGLAEAQTAAPAATTTTAPAAGAAKSGGAAMDKTAISKACSLEADKQGLKGKPRKAFRSKCKHDKMKAAM